MHQAGCALRKAGWTCAQRGSPAPRHAVMGSARHSRVPPAGAGSGCRLPPCSTATRWAMARPSPPMPPLGAAAAVRAAAGPRARRCASSAATRGRVLDHDLHLIAPRAACSPAPVPRRPRGAWRCRSGCSAPARSAAGRRRAPAGRGARRPASRPAGPGPARTSAPRRHQFVQAEALAVQHLGAGLQRGQLKELLRQAPHLVALRQRRVQQRARPGRRQWPGPPGGRAAPSAACAGRAPRWPSSRGVRPSAQLSSAACVSMRWVRSPKAVSMACTSSPRRCRLALRQQDRRCGLALAVVAHAPGQAVQRQASARRSRATPGQQRGQQARHGQLRPRPARPGGCRPVPPPAGARRRRARCTGNPAAVCRPGRGKHGGAEDARPALRPMGSVPRSGSGAPARKARTGARSTCGCAPCPARRCRPHASVGVQHVDLHAGVDDHQHLQQAPRAPRGRWRRGRPRDLRPVRHDVPRQAVRQALQRLLLLLHGRLPAQQATRRRSPAAARPAPAIRRVAKRLRRASPPALHRDLVEAVAHTPHGDDAARLARVVLDLGCAAG
jgi:hypothetical protein